MNTDLVSVDPESTVAEAAQAMSVRRVGSVLVLDGARLLGIFTERDIVRALATEHDAAGHSVGQWMTRDPATLTPDHDEAEALHLMIERGFRHVPVVEGDRAVGMVSIRDLTPRAEA
jgi:CBS domain-containing protein